MSGPEDQFRLRSNLRRHIFQADHAGERARFFFLIFAQLKQRGHRGRLELLYFGGIRIDRRPSRIWIGLARCVNLAHAFTAAGVSC